MAYPKGQPRPKGAGRQPGSTNKRRSIEDLCIEAGIDPFKTMVDLLSDEDKTMRFQASKELCQYILPKKKAMELSTDQEKGFVIKIVDYTSKK